MKKIVLSILLFVFITLPTFAKTENDSDLLLINKISKDPEIIEAIGLMKYSPARESYNIILGQNPTKNVIKVSFRNLSELDYKFTNYDAIGWLKFNRLYIYVNEKHKNAPPEALCALIASRVFNQDAYDSKNEEVYIWTLEAVVWDYFLQKNPSLADSKALLVTKRENPINKLFNKSTKDITTLEKAVRANKSYIYIENESPGFKDNEFIQKMNILLSK